MQLLPCGNTLSNTRWWCSHVDYWTNLHIFMGHWVFWCDLKYQPVFLLFFLHHLSPLFKKTHFHFRFKTLSIDFTHYHRESGLFVCVSMQLEWAQTHRVSPVLSIHPLLIPSSSSGLDLQVALTVTNANPFKYIKDRNTHTPVIHILRQKI